MLIPILLAIILQAPDPTLPVSVHAAYTTEGKGVQIYRCTLQDATFAWVFQFPEATLFDPITHKQLGTHATGPTWTWSDGSAITGKVLQKTPSPNPASIPWLLLEAKPTGTIPGALTPITLVRRSDTKGGNPLPTGCDADHRETTLRVPYTATYTFYTP